jgi:phosphoribosyl 1,2-cyclic phosphate phosphodiesterase
MPGQPGAAAGGDPADARPRGPHSGSGRRGRLNQLQGEPIDVYASPRTLETLEKIFPYARADRVDATLELPRLWYKPITGPFTLLGQDIIPCDLPHGGATSLGFRLGPLGYCTDFHAMADEVVERLRGVRVMILGALRPTPHATHLSFRQAVDLARRIGAPRTYFVHLSHHVRHADQREHLPEGIEFAHDGLKITI